MEDRIEIDSAEITEFVYIELTQRGFAITDDEAEEIADVFFDLLLFKGIMEEE